MLPDGLKEFGIGKRAADKSVFIRVAEVKFVRTSYAPWIWG